MLFRCLSNSLSTAACLSIASWVMATSVASAGSQDDPTSQSDIPLNVIRAAPSTFLNANAIAKYATENRRPAIFDLSRRIQMNLRFDKGNLSAEEINRTRIEFIQLAAKFNPYLALNVTVDFTEMFRGSPPYHLSEAVGQEAGVQTMNFFAGKGLMARLRNGDVPLEDNVSFRSSEPLCYVEVNEAKRFSVVYTDLGSQTANCLYFTIISHLGLKSDYSPSASSLDVPGFRLNATMAAAYALRTCSDRLDQNKISNCLIEVLRDGQ